MSRYELTISPDYVSKWGVFEAIRELLQNAIDQETVNPENKMNIRYFSDTQRLLISSKLSSLDKSSLLLGTTTKTDSKTIGKFGEGYKLAILVLTRLNKSVQILNYKLKELWAPKIIDSKRFSSKLLVVDVKKYVFSSVPDYDLTFVISNFTTDDYNHVADNVLFLQKSYLSIKTSRGEVLLDEKHKGHVYVKGLFVCKCGDEGIKYGYNVKPQYLTLDRDRSLVDSFNLQWMTSQLWRYHTDVKFVASLILEGVADVKYLNNHISEFSSDKLLPEAVFNNFQYINGPSCIPVSDQFSLDNIKKHNPKLKPIITDHNSYQIMSMSQPYKDIISTTRQESNESLYSMLCKFYKKYENDLYENMKQDLLTIIDKYKE